MADDFLPPLRQGEERSAWVLLRLEADLRQRIERVRATLADPALPRTVEQLGNPDPIHLRMAELAEQLEEALRTLGALRGALTHPREGARKEGRRLSREEGVPPGLPETLERFLRDRVHAPGFSYTVGHDPVRGWTVRWEERNSDGKLYASGRLHQRPWEWMKPQPPTG